MKRQVHPYLHAATRGLWGAKRREVQAELLGHIEARAQEFQLAGLSREEALRRTLVELGAPEQVRRGMTHVYLTPVAVNSALVSAFAAVALFSLATLTAGQAQVRVYSPTFAGPPTALYVDGQEFLNELRQHGATVKGPALQPSITFPGSTKAVQVNWEQDGGIGLLTNPQDHRTYVNVGVLVHEASRAGFPVRLQGWNNPTLRLNTLSVQLGDEEQRVDAFALYSMVLNRVVLDVLGRGVAYDLLNTTLGADLWAARWKMDVEEVEHHVKLGARSGNVYALLIVEPSVKTFGSQVIPRTVFDIAPATGDGTVHFRLPQGYTHLKLTGNIHQAREALKVLARDEGASQHNGSRWRPAVALLVELNGKLGRNADTYKTVSIDRSSIGTIRKK